MDFLENRLDFGLFLADCCAYNFVERLKNKMNEASWQNTLLA
jgi:hypothetical protein